jgi:hypothetical protein
VFEQLWIFGDETMNRAEGFFGSVKHETNQQIDHLIRIAVIVKSLVKTSMACLFHTRNSVETSLELLMLDNIEHIF